MAVYAVSDIHGYYDLFLKGLSEIGYSYSDLLWKVFLRRKRYAKNK